MFRVKKSLSLIFALAAIIMTGAVGARAETKNASYPIAVVELFTSQGCSSCPPADAYMGKLAEIDGVLPLSFHVGYWDYIGWKDKFAFPATTKRQKAYARSLGSRYVYTPQMVVNGKDEIRGHNPAALDSAIRKYAANPSFKEQRPLVRLGHKGAKLRITLPAKKREGRYDVYLVAFDEKHATPVKRGENAGREITNYNVVRSLKHVGEWTGEQAFETTAFHKASDKCAVLIQSRGQGMIVAAAVLPLNR